MSPKVNYASLPTEQNNAASRHIDRLSISKALNLIHRENTKVNTAVQRQTKAIEKAIQVIVASLKAKGRLFFLGAGTSGRLGILEAAECPPTFNTPPSLVQAFMAGGRGSVFRSKEGAEDQGSQSKRIVRKKIKKRDVVVGIAASGVTAYVRDGLKAAKTKGAQTILVTCHPSAPRSMAHVVIALKTGPEVIAGSTRLKAGTATKLVLNSLTVVSMIQLGKVYGNRMVDLQPKSKKLTARAVNLISHLGNVSRKKSEALLRLARGNAKTAIVMAKKKLSYSEAKKRLTHAQGHLHKVLSK